MNEKGENCICKWAEQTPKHMPQGTPPRRCSPGLPSSPPAYLPAPLGRVRSSLRFLGDNQPDFLIPLPLNPFSPQSSYTQMLKSCQEPSRTSLFLPLHNWFSKAWICSTPQNSPRNAAYPSIPTASLARNTTGILSPTLAPMHPNRTVTNPELCPICASYPPLKILCQV